MSQAIPEQAAGHPAEPVIIARSGAPVQRQRSDLFALPLVGRWLKSAWLLTPLRLAVFALFAAAVYYGFVLPDAAENQVTTAIFWSLFWPFFMLVTMPTLGPVICTICPHGTPYLGLALVLVGYWLVYYSFNAFKSPLVTAWLFAGLTVVAALMFLRYEGMAYCHSLCPISAIKSAFSKVGFAFLSTYRSACDECKTFDCAKACEYELSPFNFDKNNSMGNCTLCMDCAQACDAVRWRLTKPSFTLLGSIRKMQKIDIWVYILLLAVISITMRFHHALGRTALNQEMPWVQAGSWLNQQFPVLVEVGVDSNGMMALCLALVLTLSITLGSFYLASRILQQSYQKIFLLMGYALAPLMVVGGLSHVGEFFFLHYYSDLANAANQLMGATGEPVAALAKRGESWLHSFKLFQYLATAWCLLLLVKRLPLVSEKVNANGWRRWAALPVLAAMPATYLGLLLYTGYVFSTYGAAVMHHH